jgi:hypothetical protein
MRGSAPVVSSGDKGVAVGSTVVPSSAGSGVIESGVAVAVLTAAGALEGRLCILQPAVIIVKNRINKRFLRFTATSPHGMGYYQTTR